MSAKKRYIKSKIVSDSLYKAILGSHVLVLTWTLFFFSGLSPLDAGAENLTTEAQHESLSILQPEDTDSFLHGLYSPKESNPVPENSDESDKNEKTDSFDATSCKAACLISSLYHSSLYKTLSALPGQDSLRNRNTVSLVILYQSWKICFDCIS